MNIYFVWILSFSLFTGQLGLLVILAWRKLKLSNREVAIDQEYDFLSDSFSSYMIDTSDDRFIDEIQESPYKFVVLERLLNNYVSLTKAGVTSPIIAKLSEDFLAARYAKQLNRRNWALRMNALHFIEDFHIQSLTPLLKKKLSTVSQLDQEAQQLIRTLASLNEPVTISVLGRYPNVSARLYIDVFKRLDELTKLEELDAALKNEKDNKLLKQAAISYIGMAGLTLFLPRIEEELQYPDEEIRIQALKALFHMQNMTTPELLTPFLQSASWQERMFSAQVAGALQLSRYKEKLSDLLGDPVWRVRYSSAEALTKFSDGDILLTHIANKHPDRYARDMATQWKTSLLGSEQ